MLLTNVIEMQFATIRQEISHVSLDSRNFHRAQTNSLLAMAFDICSL